MPLENIRYSREWLKQAKYDIDTAKAMLKAGRNIYCVFMCHLSLEKAFKALYVMRVDKNPPKIHSLVYFAQKVNLDLPRSLKEFIEKLDEVSVPTRYPDELEKILKEYNKPRTKIIFAKAKELLEWLKAKTGKQ